MKTNNTNTANKFDFNNPIPENEIEVLSREDTGTKKITRFKYADNYYTQTYNYGKGYGFKFIEKYKSADHQQKALSQQGEMIYSSTLESDCSPFGVYLEYSLMKNGSLNNPPVETIKEVPNPTEKEVAGSMVGGEDFEIVKNAVYRAYDYLFALGYFTTPTNEGSIVENYLIQARIRVIELKYGYDKLVAENNQLKTELDAVRKDNDYISEHLTKLKAENERLEGVNKRLNFLLEDLTPGGSEFVNEPEYCAQWVKEQIAGIPSIIRPFKKENAKLKADNDALVSALRDLFEDTKGHYESSDEGTDNAIHQKAKAIINTIEANK